jgi:hypothetical protein
MDTSAVVEKAGMEHLYTFPIETHHQIMLSPPPLKCLTHKFTTLNTKKNMPNKQTSYIHLFLHTQPNPLSSPELCYTIHFSATAPPPTTQAQNACSC